MMDPAAFERLKEYLESLKEPDIWELLCKYFIHRQVQADIVHYTGEHGMDVVACVDRENDFLHKGYNIIIQAKKGKLDLSRWRKEVLYQILELPYYSIPHPNYVDHFPRRVLLIVIGEITPETRKSIKEFNKHHDVTIETFELNDLITLFDHTGFATRLLEEITGVGQPELVSAEVPTPPAVGG